MKKAALFLLSVWLALPLAGCNTFERTTFQTLSASKAVIDQSQADYEARTISNNACAYSLINDAKAAQTIAVNAMVVYEEEKAASKDLTSQTSIVVADVALIAPLIVKVKSLSSNPAICGDK